MTELQSFIKTYKDMVESVMVDEIDRLKAPLSLKKSMHYSLTAGGKRIRPILMLAVMSAFGADCSKGVKAAAAIEMVHTYSLIHDDLPSMDDDDLRRGKPTNHKVYGEALAILAGDALLTHSFYLLSTSPFTDRQKLELISSLSLRAGAEGMVGGQVADIEGENTQLTADELESIHLRKTGLLLQFSVSAGSIMSGVTEEQQRKLEDYALHIGLAFQIRDDVLDVEGNEIEIGKPVGSDESRNKSTYPALLGMQGAKEKLSQHLHLAKAALEDLPLQNNLLHELADMVVNRTS
ncbi:polyprenyl synthetase family protein [Jeotgalibacillus proteolyticus]